MGKQILTTLVFTIMFFGGGVTLSYLTGVNDWHTETRDDTIIVAMAFFLGYDQARRNKDRH